MTRARKPSLDDRRAERTELSASESHRRVCEPYEFTNDCFVLGAELVLVHADDGTTGYQWGCRQAETAVDAVGVDGADRALSNAVSDPYPLRAL